LNDGLISKNIGAKFINILVIEVKLALIVVMNITWVINNAAICDGEVY
jgi:hypothetical protein